MPLGGLLLPPGCPPPRPLPPSTYPSGDETEAKMTPNPQASTIVGPRSAGMQQAGLVSASTLCSAGTPPRFSSGGLRPGCCGTRALALAWEACDVAYNLGLGCPALPIPRPWSWVQGPSQAWDRQGTLAGATQATRLWTSSSLG